MLALLLLLPPLVARGGRWRQPQPAGGAGATTFCKAVGIATHCAGGGRSVCGADR
ncbi:hypothetical protein KCP71_01255 [Salmonella enterica subsp. enterica]|nr:hypothetical protein KCP71_01255 [Salmonella enterica subsp. enterica]